MSFISAVIVAAGKGTRMGPNIDKLFLEVAGRPIVAHTWAAIDSCREINEVILVIRPEMHPEFEKLAASLRLHKPYRFAPGGAERQNSVWNGIQHIYRQADIVVIQDGARPCTTHKIISDTIAAARECGASVAAQKVTDTLKESDDGKFIARNIDRSRLWSVQTPQTFRAEIIRSALAEVFARMIQVTDDTAACELIGQPVQLVPSATPNPKATAPADLPFIETVLRQLARE